MRSTNIILFIAVNFLIVSGCVSRKLQSVPVDPVFPIEKTALMEEMAGYAILYTLHNHISQFSTDAIRNREMRNKMEQLGTKTSVHYKSLNHAITDSTVVFQQEYSTSNWHYRIEYWYDFATFPLQRAADSVLNYDNRLVRVNDRIFYRIDRYKRERFPMM